MARSIRERFERSVDTSGDHNVWTGATRADTGTGRMRVNGKELAAHQVAWELEHGPLEHGARLLPCPDVPACVQVDHLRLIGETGDTCEPTTTSSFRGRARKGGGSMREIGSGVWELAAPAGHYDNGSRRREYRRVIASGRDDAARQLVAFVAEIQGQRSVARREDRDVVFDSAIEQFLTEHLAAEKGREPTTVSDYRRLHLKWFSPILGRRRVRDIDEAAIDDVFGRMKRAGLSRSRMNHARSLYAPFFKWAKTRRLVLRNPMLEFQLPTSTQVSRERTPPELDELSILLNVAVDLTPDIAPLLTLGAVTGMRRGELVGVRRSRILWDERRLTVDTAIDAGRRVKRTKTRKERSLYIDDETVAMLARHCAAMDERASIVGVPIDPDAFLFSLAVDCSTPMPPGYVTKRVAVLKDHLGIADKKTATIELEDEALRLFRLPPTPRPPGRTGPTPRGGTTMKEIGERLGRSERWAGLAVAAAERREAAALQPLRLAFDGSILALRKFTSSELLDAGFNLAMVAHRQGHGPQVLVKHYAKSRRSADRRAADHLGSVVHAGSTTPRS